MFSFKFINNDSNKNVSSTNSNKSNSFVKNDDIKSQLENIFDSKIKLNFPNNSSTNENKRINLIDEKQLITTYSVNCSDAHHDSKTKLPVNSNPKRKYILKKTDIKHFVTKEVETSYKLDKSQIKRKLTEEEEAKIEKRSYFKGNSKKPMKPPSKLPNTSKKNSSKVAEKKIEEGGFARIISGKHSGRFGMITFVEDDAVKVFFETIDKEVTFYAPYVKAITEEEFQALNKTNIKEEKPDKSETDLVEPIANDWLFTGLHVKIVDKSYKAGSCYNRVVVIEDVYDLDECVCVTSEGELLYDITSAMLAPVAPSVNHTARILGGRHVRQVVTVKKIKNFKATVFQTYTEEEFAVDLRLLCRINVFQ